MDKLMVFDIGGSSIKWSVMDVGGTSMCSGKEAVPQSADVFFELLAQLCKNQMLVYELKGIAISSPGAVDVETGIVGGASAIPYIHGPNFKAILKAKTGLEVAIENDANCAALGESWLGAGKGYEDMAFVVCGTGIGGALIKSGKLHKGVHLHGGEFGYCILGMDPKAENPYGTWSRLGSTGALLRNYAQRSGEDVSHLSGEIIFEKAQEGDENARQSIEDFYRYMAMGIYNIQYSYDPEVIVMGGAISERKDFLSSLKMALDHIFDCGAEGTIRPLVKCSENGNKANLLGALRHFLISFPS